jgi:hypothetical protein
LFREISSLCSSKKSFGPEYGLLFKGFIKYIFPSLPIFKLIMFEFLATNVYLADITAGFVS